MQNVSKDPIGEFEFGPNKILADSDGGFTIRFAIGGNWSFDFDEINKLDTILADLDQVKSRKAEKSFWRTNEAKLILVKVSNWDISDLIPPDLSQITLIESGNREASFYRSELRTLRKHIRTLTSYDSPVVRKTSGKFSSKNNIHNEAPFSYSIFGTPSQRYSYDIFVLMPFALSLKPVSSIVNVGDGVIEGVIVDVDVGVRVRVGVNVRVDVGVNVGPNNCPGAQLEKSRAANNKFTA